MTNTDIYFTSDVLKIHPAARDSTIRSLIRRKYVVPLKHNHQFIWTHDQVMAVRDYFVSRENRR